MRIQKILQGMSFILPVIALMTGAIHIGLNGGIEGSETPKLLFGHFILSVAAYVSIKTTQFIINYFGVNDG
ncbi:hypothetical protein V6259_18030 [Marinomonas sp. TI.3.20]|uniref:hypothetical protein n=1 Tax=Marinomonas sp. TI.3.20 TaxID=3121296 RepID=UPI00311FD7CA